MRQTIIAFSILCAIGVSYVKPCGLSYTPPTAVISGPEEQAVRIGSAYTFYGTASLCDQRHHITNYHWDFGDGHTCDETTGIVTYVYNSGSPHDVHTVGLTVTDNGGRSSEPFYCGVHLREGSPVTWYVRHEGQTTTPYDGTSWASAFKTIEDAVAHAQPGDQVWVAAATTDPWQYVPQGNDRNATFGVCSSTDPCNGCCVSFYGGFTGTESSPDDRYFSTATATILSGDRGTQGIRTDNCYRVVSFWRPARIDGFTIRGGQSDDATDHYTGAGYCGRTTIANCRFENNYAISGGALNPTGGEVVNCTFENNTAQNGGAIYTASAVKLTRCEFGTSSNSASGDGGGIWAGNGAIVDITNCTFSQNQADNRGGGIYATNSTLKLKNCVFDRNTASRAGGMIARDGSHTTLQNCTFSKNSASATTQGEGAGFRAPTDADDEVTVTNCIFWGNTSSSADPQGQVYVIDPCEVSFNYNCANECASNYLNGSHNMASDPCFVHANTGDMHLRSASQCIDAGWPTGDYTGQTDIDGEDRVARSLVDMGADEYTIRVPYDYTTIQAAINAAAANDVIVVAPGTYFETTAVPTASFTGNKVVTVVSRDPEDPRVVAQTIIKVDTANSSSIDAVVFDQTGNTSSVLRGFTIKGGRYGIQYAYASSPQPLVSNCVIKGNACGMYVGTPISLRNCVIARNTSRFLVGGVDIECSGACEFVNCTITGNNGYGINNPMATPDIIRNCIVWGNGEEGDDICVGNAPVLSYSCIKDDDGGTVNGNIHADPLFMDVASDDYRLTYTSPCVGAGNLNGVTTDMGAYGNTWESISGTDSDGDGISDAWERHYWPDDALTLHGPDDIGPDGLSNWVNYLFGYNRTAVMGSVPFCIKSFRANPPIIDAFDGGTVGISWIMNKAANCTVLFKNDQGTPVRQLIRANVPAGVVLVPWDGTDENGLVAYNSFYDVIISAQSVANPSETTTWTSSHSNNNSTFSSFSLSTTNFNPYANVPAQIDFDVPSSYMHISAEVRNSRTNVVRHHFMPERIMGPGHYTVYWDGRTDNGSIYEGDFQVWLWEGWAPTEDGEGTRFPARIGEVGVLWQYPESITQNLLCNSYRIIPTYNEVSTITYMLGKDAYVTIEIKDPDGNHCRTLFSSQEQAAGPQECRWDGKNDSGRYISKEGVYRVIVSVESPAHRDVKTSRTGAITAYK
jgi:predicted outer membrane repeat protein